MEQNLRKEGTKVKITKEDLKILIKGLKEGIKDYPAKDIRGYNNSGLEYLYSQLFQWHNPYWTFGFFYLLNFVIKFISKKLKKNYK